MTFTAKLVFGGLYIYKDHKFELGVPESVTADEAKYLKTVMDARLVQQGDGWARISVPVFQITEVVPTQEEKVLEEIKDAPDSLRPKK